ncbi:ATP-binding protein [Vibrio ordalii]|uniref:ATP-binding protein n=1 Tax=Vibrio ordalii TaxID=28174 RepID=UPI00024833DB|nr:ATP-binding protein [Vibrio ordalii]
MRRIYIESFVGLLLFFLATLITIELVVYQLGTDYDYVLEDYQAEAFHDLVTHIYQREGEVSTLNVLKEYADKTRQIMGAHTEKTLPSDIRSFFFTTAPNAHTYYDNDRFLWLLLTPTSPIYSFKPDEESSLRQAIFFADNLSLFLLVVGFALYCVLLIWFISRRLRELEKVTLAFAAGDLTVRASIKSSNSVGSLNKSFNYMASKISALVLSNKALSNAVAHELRTPIFRIQWQAEMLADESLTPKQAAKVASIIEDTEEMETMVDELLYYAKVERPENELNMQTIQLNYWLESVLDKWRSNSVIDIKLLPLAKEASLQADPYLLKRVLDNLLGNAQKYAKGKIIVEASVNNAGQAVQIDIHDDGEGIDSEHWPFIFDAFYSADFSRGERQSGFGLGLGLAIVKQIVLRHNGEVSVAKSVLGGACFTLVLPVAGV